MAHKIATSKSQKSIRKTLVTSVFFIQLAVLIVVLVLHSVFLFSVSLQQAMREGEKNLNGLDMQLGNLTSNLKDIQKLLLQDPVIASYLFSANPSSIQHVLHEIDVSQRLEQIVKSYQYIDSISLFYGEGENLFVSRNRVSYGRAPTRPLPIEQTEAYATATASSITFGGVFQKSELHSNPNRDEQREKLVSILLPLKSIWDTNTSVIFSINIPFDFFHFLTEGSFFGQQIIYLFDGKGQLLLNTEEHTDKESVAKEIGLLVAAQEAPIGHMRLQNGYSPSQLLYQKSPQTGWLLVQKIPFRTIVKSISPLQKTSAITSSLSIILAMMMGHILSRKILHSVQTMSKSMHAIGRGELTERLPTMEYYELELLSQQFNAMMEQIETHVQEKKLLEEQKRMLEIETLQSQINPHFLYNSLTTIRWMASMARASNVCQALLALTNVLQPIFSEPGIEWTLRQELIFIENLIDILQYRFMGSITLLRDIPEELLELQVLRFLLQPLVENSILHGFEQVNPGTILIRAVQTGSLVTLTVEDDGIGIPADQLSKLHQRMDSPSSQQAKKQPGYGLYNVNQRVRLHYGEEYGLTITSQPQKKTIATLHLPYQ